ncbi:Chaperone protein dnaJ 49 [Spatholobus suberectus]|nr:Chaperone protein dnaJ 49 [Spatholobus suberectus]
MECNKDEAARAKEIAERKFSEREYASAKKFALKALNLFPALEGLSQFLTTLDVYISAENKINGEMDWYGILHVSPFADEDTVRKQYRKLALTLHPDKNKSPGAEGAFKLVSEAWSLLSDKVKRLAYNQNRSSEGFQHNAPNHVGSQSEAPSSNGFYNLNKNATSRVRTGHNDARAHPTSIPPLHTKAGTFWTICNRCRTHYEYLRIYLNHTLLCPNCNEAFVAIEKGPPPNVFKSSNWSSRQHPQKSSRQHPNVGRNHPVNPGRTGVVSQNLQSSGPKGTSFNTTNFQWGPHSRMAGFVRRDGSSTVAATNVKQHSSETRREDEGVPSIAAWERSHVHKRSDGPFTNVESPMKKIRTDDIYMYNANHMTTRDGPSGFGHFYESGKANMGTERTHGFSGAASKHYSMRELSLFELQNMLIDKAQTEIRKKLQEWRSMAEAKISNKDKGNKRQKSTFNDKTTGPEKHGGSTINGNRHVDSDSAPVTSDDTVKEKPAYVTINVPDPDFHNFDLDRAENSFAEDQVWAAYDNDDGMPRYYARIHKVISTKPFRMRISWLNSRSNSELGPIDWVGSGFYKTCGDFRTGRHEITESLNSFSHKVRWTKGTRGVVRIFPGKGEVWALYRNWSPDWNENTPDEVIHKYDMVEVLEDFNEEEGVLVTPLVKVDGFRTVFLSHSHDQARMIPKGEMFRFSHQVPNYLLTGQEAHNAPKGCRELDPAATPLDLLQTTAKAKEALDHVRQTKEDMLPGSPEKQAAGKGENASKTSRADMLDEDAKQVNYDR